MMMEYFKRRFSSTENSINEQIVIEDDEEVVLEEKTKVLLVIDTQEIDW